MAVQVNVLRWLPSFRDLEDDQRRAVTDDFGGTSLVYGPAGGGKTAITLYRAKTLHDQGTSFRVFVFTRVLLAFIKTAASELGLPPDSIESFYRWVWREHSEHLGRPAEGPDERENWRVWTRDLLAFFRANPQRVPTFDYVLVDEAQDFEPNVTALLRLMTSNLFIAGDAAQSLYGDTGSYGALPAQWGPVDRQALLLGNYRNPKAVAHVAALFLDSQAWPAQLFVEQTKGRQHEVRPIWEEVASLDEQSARIAALVRQARGAVRIGILYRNWRFLYSERKRLRALGVETQVARNGHEDQFDFDDANRPVLTTIHSAKGLEFDWVILPGLDADTWDALDPARDEAKERRLFFVALTRTKDRLFLLSRTGQTCSFVRAIPAHLLQRRDAHALRDVVASGSGPASAMHTPAPGTPRAPRDDDPF